LEAPGKLQFGAVAMFGPPADIDPIDAPTRPAPPAVENSSRTAAERTGRRTWGE